MTSLKQRVVAVAAANRHTAVLTDAGAIFSWGSNDQGQLGYGTSDSASNAVPRQVEAMKVCYTMSLLLRHVIVFLCSNCFILLMPMFCTDVPTLPPEHAVLCLSICYSHSVVAMIVMQVPWSQPFLQIALST